MNSILILMSACAVTGKYLSQERNMHDLGNKQSKGLRQQAASNHFDAGKHAARTFFAACL